MFEIFFEAIIFIIAAGTISIQEKVGGNCTRLGYLRAINKLMFNRLCVRVRVQSPGADCVSLLCQAAGQWWLTCGHYTPRCVVIGRMKVWLHWFRICVSGPHLRHLLGELWDNLVDFKPYWTGIICFEYFPVTRTDLVGLISGSKKSWSLRQVPDSPQIQLPS